MRNRQRPVLPPFKSAATQRPDIARAALPRPRLSRRPYLTMGQFIELLRQTPGNGGVVVHDGHEVPGIKGESE